MPAFRDGDSEGLVDPEGTRVVSCSGGRSRYIDKSVDAILSRCAGYSEYRTACSATYQLLISLLVPFAEHPGDQLSILDSFPPVCNVAGIGAVSAGLRIVVSSHMHVPPQSLVSVLLVSPKPRCRNHMLTSYIIDRSSLHALAVRDNPTGSVDPVASSTRSMTCPH